MRALRHLLLSACVLVLLTATLSAITPPAAAANEAAVSQALGYPAGVTAGTVDARGRLSNPDLAACDEERPEHQYVTYPSYAQTADQICGMWAMQNAAKAAYDALHGYDEDRESSTTELYVQAGFVQNFLHQIARALAKGETDLSTHQLAAYDWYRAIQQEFQRTAASEALREYQKWERELCGYRPPNTEAFTYNPTNQPVCNPDGRPGLVGLFTTVAPPTYANFVQYGRYNAEQILGVASGAPPRADDVLIDKGILTASGAIAGAMLGSAPHLAATLNAGGGALKSFVRLVAPKNGDYLKTLKPLEKTATKVVQQVSQLGKQAGERAAKAAARLGSKLVKTGARFMSGPMTIATIAITIAVERGIVVFAAAEIPQKLAADVAAAQPANPRRYVLDLLTAREGAEAPIVHANYRAQLVFPPHTVGVETTSAQVASSRSTSARGAVTAADCPECVVYDEIPLSPENPPARIRITALHPDGTPSGWSRIAETVDFINTWGMGSANGALGVPHVSVGIAGGQVWTKRGVTSAPTEESEAGLTGWLPSGELRYFDPSGQPMIAYLNGDKFLTQTSPGSVSAGGLDEGNDCATPGQCTASSSIVVMGSGGTPELRNEITGGSFLGIPCTANSPGTHDCLTDTLVPTGRLVPASGTTIVSSDGEVLEQKGTSRLYRLTIVPNRGTAPAVWVTNRHNSIATNKTNGLPPGGGLVAGETVTFAAPESSPAGYDTTYTWHVQTVCPADPDRPAQTIQGVLVCSDNPSYGKSRLPDNEQNLTSCVATVGVCRPESTLGVTWTPDPAFNGGPVATLTGRSVEWTWPAPGTYNLRLVTTDEYGVTQMSDRELVVSAARAPRSPLSFAAAADPQPSWIAPSVIDPVTNGNALTVTGCVESPTTVDGTAYATPEITVDWGDGTEAGPVTLVRGAGGGCSTPWRWEATHTYDVDTGSRPFVQVPITVTTRDVTFPVTAAEDLPPSTQASSTTRFYANVHAPTAPPSFVGGGSVIYDVAAGVRTPAGGSVTSVPHATLSQAPASGVTHQGAACTPGLPGGMGFATSAANTFYFSGIPRADAGGCYAVTLTATNPHGSAEQQAVVAVAQSPEITSGTAIGWDTNDPEHSFTITTTGFPAPRLTVTDVDCTTGCGTALPESVTFTDNGDGTATLATDTLSDADTGVYEITVEATGASGTARQTITLTIDGPPVFTSPTVTGFTTGQAGAFQIGVSSTTPATLTCRVPDSDDRCRSGDGSRPYISANLAAGTGLLLDGTAITGIPSVAGSFPVTLTATNGVGTTTQELTILVSASGGASITMVPAASPNLVSYQSAGTHPAGTATFIVGDAGSVTICSNHPGDTLRTETVAGGRSVATPLPTGLSITRTGATDCPSGHQQFQLSGTPTAPHPMSTGATAYRLVSEANGLALLTLNLVGAPAFSSPDRAMFAAGEPGTFPVTIGTRRYLAGTYYPGCVTGATGLPAGLRFTGEGNAAATISGTPVAGGRSTVTVTGSDCAGASTQQQLTIEVTEAPRITSESGAGFRVGEGGSFAITTNPTAHPKPTLTVSGLPAGATFLDQGDGTGTLQVAPTMPATDEPVTLQVSARSSSGTDTQTLQLVVGDAPTAVSPGEGATVALPRGESASYDVAFTGAPAPSLTASDLPAGLTFTDHGDGTGTIDGTPTAVGETEVTIRARNGVGPAATTTLTVVVTEAAGFSGTTTDGSCDSASAVEEHEFVAASDDTWTLCGSGSPVPTVTLQSVTCTDEPVSLPPGLTFADHGDGSASFEGAAEIGSGTACTDGYLAEVAFANAGGTVTQEVTLRVREALRLASDPTTAPFVPGAPNAAVISAAGSPLPSLAVDPTSDLPGWLTFVDQGDGTATVSGTPPASAAGTTITFDLRVSNGSAAPLLEEITVPVSDLALTGAEPPTAYLGTTYSHQFEVADGVDVAVADGGALPQGLTLSSSGVLSGIPEEVGRFPVPLTLSRHGDRATTAVIELQVGVHPGALVISQFRTLAPGDWFVQVVNTTDVPIELTGWSVAAQQVGEEETSEVPLGTGPLEPGGTAVVTNPFSSLRSQLVVTGLSGGEVPIESGFAIVAPNGAVTDAAGVDGALSNLAEGTGLSYPSQLRKEHLRYAFVRSGFDVGEPVDTDDNATDFSFAPVVGVEFPPDDPDPAAVRVDFDVAAPVFGQPVTATATVTGVVASTGAVQFAVDGAAVGPPVVLVDGSATSTVLDALPVGSHVVTATFRPSGSGAVLVGEGRLTVGRAATTTAVSVRANALSAKVTPVAPGAGDPTGTVTFLVDGVEVGTALIESGVATLARAAAGGATRTIGAAYAGDDSFTGSSGSTARQDPKITARVSSTKPRRKTGWYRTPVTVTFSCTPAGAPLTEPCPAPVTLRREGAGRVVTRTVVATDGGVATVVVSPINIDRTGPKVRIRGIRGPGARGWPPRGTCVATDALSGVASCTLSRRIRPKRVVYVVVAADRAGNTSTRRVVLMRER